MLRIFLSAILGYVVLPCVFGQSPTVFGTQLVNGSYATYALTDLCAFSQVRLQATSSAATGTRNWEFATGTAGAPVYTNNWRPYTAGLTLAGFNQVIAPLGGTASALYNTASGGSSGLLPAITNGMYYTINVTDANGPINQTMSILETSYMPVSIMGIVPMATASCSGFMIDVNLSGSLSSYAGENIFVRYSTDNFVNSSIAQGSVYGACGKITIPPLPKGTSVNYYVFTSNRTQSQLLSAVSTFGQVAYDMFTLSLINNACANYTYTVPTTMPSVALMALTGANVCSGNKIQLMASGSGGTAFTSPRQPYNYAWSMSPSSTVISNSDKFCINSATLGSAGTYIVTVTDMAGCTMTSSIPVTVVATSPITAPTSLTVDRNNFCSNDPGNIVLTASGASGDSLIFYKNMCDTIKGEIIGRMAIASGTALTISSPDITTSYFVQGKSVCGTLSPCISVSVLVKPIPQLTFAKQDGACIDKGINDGSILVTSSLPSTTYTWTPASVSPNPSSGFIKCLAPGSYSVTATSNGCSTISSLTVN